MTIPPAIAIRAGAPMLAIALPIEANQVPVTPAADANALPNAAQPPGTHVAPTNAADVAAAMTLFFP